MPRFTQEDKARMDALVARYPERKAALIPALWMAQDVYDGWLPEEAMQEVADLLRISRAEVEGVATYYTMFNKSPIGKHHVEVCHNISCMVLGADEMIHHCERRLGIVSGETTADGQITLSRAECLGACAHAPAVQVGGTYYENMSIEKMDQLIDHLKSQPEGDVASPPQARMPVQDTF